MDWNKTVRNLRERGFSASYFDSGAEAADYLVSQISGCTVGFGGSRTLETLGLYERLGGSNQVFWHWKTGANARREAVFADVYLSGANAISEDGEILNIDGVGNRLAGTLYGHRKVYIVAGINKLCPDFDAALYRARNVAAVQNCARFGKKTPCQKDGRCHDCRSPERICRALTVLWAPMNGMETEVVLIGEAYGM